jgi:hypothetical protein
VLALILLWTSHASIVLASSEGNITFDPASGPVGTPISVEIRLFPAAARQYALKATSADAALGDAPRRSRCRAQAR